jgi:mannose-6-phosphate isomerase-like protein (cupin superfamily)
MNDIKAVKAIKLTPGEKYQRLLSYESGTFGVKSGHVILNSGEKIGLHSTREREEVIIVLKGEGEAAVGQEKILKIEKNSVLYIPPETEHDINNTGIGILEYVYVTSVAQNA